MQIKGNAAIVTGAASGMGAETARFLAAHGAKVILLDINKEALTEVANHIGGLPVVCDVANAESIERAVTQGVDAYGEIRIAVNCAGVCPAKRIVGREGAMGLEDFNRVIQINLCGTFNLMRVIATHMSTLSTLNEDHERGVIINTASVAAYEGQIGQAAYSASKGGIVGMTLPAARELARFGVRVVTIAPGIMETPMLTGLSTEVQASLGAQVPFPKRLGKPSEYAALVGHIIENAMINGSVIRLDGAIRMQEK